MKTETIALLFYLVALAGVLGWYRIKSNGYQPKGKQPVNPPKFK